MDSEGSYRSVESNMLYMSDVKAKRTPSPAKDNIFENDKKEDNSASE